MSPDTNDSLRGKINFLLLVVLFSIVVNYFDNIPRDLREETETSLFVSVIDAEIKCNKSLDVPKYWSVCINKWNPRGNLRTMDRVFERIGYASVNGSRGDEWDVLWSYEFPYSTKYKDLFAPLYRPLKPHQRINHFPGITEITDKSFVSTKNRDIKAILPGFVFPRMIKEFQEFVKANPNSRFVEKNIDNRGVRLVDEKEIKFNDQANKFYQLFMENPFLVDGRFMDFSTHVLISSLDPLRVYRYAQDVQLRFCQEPYYPFDPKDRRKYVIDDNRMSYDQHPTLKHFCNTYEFSSKNAIEHYMRKEGHNVTELWRKIDETISNLMINNEKKIKKKTLELFNSTHHFFELVRVDFILNATLDPHLTEVNLSPNLTPRSDLAEKFAPNYEQIVHDAVRLVGAGSNMALMSLYDSGSNNMLSNSKNIAVNPGACDDNNCSENCDKTECSLCITCLSENDVFNLHRAFEEKSRQGGFKRIFPNKPHFDDDDKLFKKLTPNNQLFLRWYKEKCRENSEWC